MDSEHAQPADRPGASAPEPELRGPVGATQPGVPAEIGGYRILRRLGAGGMAVVYAALQDRPRRTVALKVLKSTVATDQSRRWFKREVEILGRLHHPNVAHVHDAGTCRIDGEELPYFVMEYVPGAETIIEHIARKELSRRERLKLFVKVCAAVEHGHRHKVIHRDLKPANILIDRFGTPKVIDFGIARMADLDVDAQTMHTEAARLVGTLQYMSPEQLESRPVDLDARCDVYALGTILYRILTGRAPHDLKGLSVPAAARVVREEAPPHPGSIKRELAGDLETIVLKAMEKDRRRRYRNAGSLGRDLVRYLARKPIHARRASLWYRARLASARHRAVVAVVVTLAAVFATALAIVGTAAIVTARRAAAPSEPSARPAPPPVAAGAATPAPASFTLDGHTSGILAMAFDPQGARLVSASQDHTAIQWDLASRTALFTIDDHRGPVAFACYGADGALLATAARAGSILVVDAGDNTVRLALDAECGKISAMAIDASSSSAGAPPPPPPRVAVGCDDLTLHLYEPGSDRRRSVRGSGGAFGAVAFSADGARTAAGAEQGSVLVADRDAGRVTFRLRELEHPIVAVGFVGGTGERLVAVDASGSAIRWRLAEPPEGDRFRAGADPVASVGLDPGGRWMACASGDRIAVWSLESLERVAELTHDEPVRAVAIDPSGAWCAVGDAEGRVTLLPVPGVSAGG